MAEQLGYSEIERGINEAPITYLPALLIVVVERCVRARVFQPGGLDKVVARAVAKAEATISSLLHRYLDELLADFIDHTGKLPSQTTLLQLMNWSHEQTIQPADRRRASTTNPATSVRNDFNDEAESEAR